MTFYVVEKSRDGSRKVYKTGKLTPYAKRQPALHGYKTHGAVAGVASRLSWQVALAIYDHRALGGDRYYEENYKEYEEENDIPKERAALMTVREFLNSCTMDWHSVAIYEDLEDCYDEAHLLGRYTDMRTMPDYLLKCSVNDWAVRNTTDDDGAELIEIAIGI